ncbi:unnamed protein product [Schistosoma haematobium]|nr:unnamed protein product [Schistosoma haematobium]CAH8628783.1 unnamed protein product [Schistosoma haematobium]
MHSLNTRKKPQEEFIKSKKDTIVFKKKRKRVKKRSNLLLFLSNVVPQCNLGNSTQLSINQNGSDMNG